MALTSSEKVEQQRNEIKFPLSIFTTEDDEEIPVPRTLSTGNQCGLITDIEVSQDEVMEQLQQLESSKSPGADGTQPECS